MPGIGIEVAGLRKKLGPNQALDGTTFGFEAGLLHGLIGPDGAGKTTLLRTLMGLLKPDAGSIRFSRDGAALDFAAIRGGMAYMPQRQSLYADLSVGEHLDFFRDLYSLPEDVYRARRAELLAITRLEPFADRAAGNLSGGMYKKLGLMCSLLQSPTLLLLDEPTNGMDMGSEKAIMELLIELQKEKNTTVVFVTHLLSTIERYAHRVALITTDGKLLVGEKKEMLSPAVMTAAYKPR